MLFLLVKDSELRSWPFLSGKAQSVITPGKIEPKFMNCLFILIYFPRKNDSDGPKGCLFHLIYYLSGIIIAFARIGMNRDTHHFPCQSFASFSILLPYLKNGLTTVAENQLHYAVLIIWTGAVGWTRAVVLQGPELKWMPTTSKSKRTKPANGHVGEWSTFHQPKKKKKTLPGFCFPLWVNSVPKLRPEPSKPWSVFHFPCFVPWTDMAPLMLSCDSEFRRLRRLLSCFCSKYDRLDQKAFLY